MRHNVGRVERRVRGAAGIVLLAAALVIQWPGAWEGLVGAIGAVLLATAIFRYCPVNQLVGRDAARR
jgi:hypothetical protein